MKRNTLLLEHFAGRTAHFENLLRIALFMQPVGQKRLNGSRTEHIRIEAHRCCFQSELLANVRTSNGSQSHADVAFVVDGHHSLNRSGAIGALLTKLGGKHFSMISKLL